MRAHTVLPLLLLTLAAPAQAERTQAKALKQTLSSISGNKQLLRRLAHTGSQIELGTMKQELVRERAVLHASTGLLGMTEITATMRDKVSRTNKLVLTANGLEVHSYDRIAPFTEASRKEYVADLEAQLAKKPDYLFFNKTPTQHEAFGPEQLTQKSGVHLGGLKNLFSRKQKLDLAAWSKHVAPATVEAAVAGHAK